TAVNTYTGTTVLDEGTIGLAASGALSTATLLRLRGGRLLLNAGSPAAHYTTILGALQIDGGESRLAIAPGTESATVNVASLTHVSGTIDISAEGLGSTVKIFIAGLADGLIGPWATVNGGAALAAYSSTLGIHAANLPEQTLSALGPSVINNNAGEIARITTAGTAGGITLGANPTAVAVLSQETVTDAVVTFGGSTLSVPRVQITPGAAVLTLGATPGDGVLTAPASAGNKLILANANAAGGAPLNVNVALQNDGANDLHFEKSGPGDVRLLGPVAHTGGTAINAGMLTVDVPADVVRDLPNGAISGNGGLVKTGDGTLAFANVANSYAGTTVVSRGTVRVLHNATFGSTAAPTVVQDGAALDLWGSSDNGLRLGGEHVYVSGAGPDGQGALRNTGTRSQFWALSYATLLGNLTVYCPQRLDLRGNNASVTFMNLNGHGITKKGTSLFGFTNTTVTNDQGTSFIDIQDGGVTLEVAASLSGGADNVMSVRNGAYFDFYNVSKPIGWTLSLDEGSRVYTRLGFTTNLNNWSGPVILNGNVRFDGGGVCSDTYTGELSGTGRLVKVGNDNSITYLRNTNNSWAGGAVISNGVLYAVAPAALPNYATAVEVANVGCLALRVADAAGTQPGFALSEINALINNGTTFSGTTTSIGFDTAYEDLVYTDMLPPQMGVRKFGPNTLTLSGEGVNLGPVRVYGGTLDLSPVSRYLGDQSVVVGESPLAADPLATLVVGGTTRIETLDKGYNVSGQPQVLIGDNGRGVLRLQDDGFIAGRLLVGNGAAALGVVHQSGGVMHNTGGMANDGRIGISGYGYYLLADGVLTNNGYTQVGSGLTGTGILEQRGGVLEFGGSYGGTIGISRGGTGVVHVTGGLFRSNATLEIGDDSDNSANAGFAVMTVCGDAVVTNNGLIEMGNRNNMTAILNLNGGELNAKRIWRANRSNTDVLVNWNGGLLRALDPDNVELFNGGAAGVYPDVTLFEGGAFVDIPSSGKALFVRTPFRRPSGFGVLSIPVTSPGAGYIAAPFVRIAGGGGKGATAFARVDLASGTVTAIEITSPGMDYGSMPSVTLIGGGATTVATLGAPVLGVPTSGGLTKLGTGSLTLESASTYLGPTEVREGSLRLNHPNALSPVAPIFVNGGTLDLCGNTLSNGSVSVTGGSIINGRVATASLVKSGEGTLEIGTPVVLGPSWYPKPLTPGLWEGMLRQNWNVTSLNPREGLQLTTRAAIGSQAANTSYAGGIWAGDNHTWIYTGFIWNRAATNETWSFRARFDDNVSLVIDGARILTAGNSAVVVANVTLTPGPHAIEMRFGDGAGSVGPTGEPYGIAYDPLGRASSNSADYRQIIDPGDGTLLTVDIPDTRGPGLLESLVLQNWNTTDTGEPVSRQLTTRAGNGAKTANSTYANGLWRGGNHTWIYTGYLWNRSETDVTWTWRFTFDDNVRLMIDGTVVKDVTLGQGVVYQNHTLTPGPHTIEIRFGDGTGDVGPASGLGGLTYDPLGRGSTDVNNYILLQDPGDGSLLTTHADYVTEQSIERPVVHVTGGTVKLNSRPAPGLFEGRVDNQSFDKVTPNPATAIELTTTAANGSGSANGSINGKSWPTNSTYVYTGFIWNRSANDVTWTFAENFDDSVLLVIDGITLINGGNGWNTPTRSTITLPPGPHAFEVRFGQGGGGVGGNVASWWTNKDMSFAVDWQGRDAEDISYYEIPVDPGDGSLFTCSAVDPFASEGVLATVEVKLEADTTLDLNGETCTVGLLSGSGAVINGTLAPGTILSPAGDTRVGTLALDGVTLSAGSSYRVTVSGTTSDCLTTTGTMDLSQVLIVPAADAELTVPTYVIARADGGFTGDKPTVSGFSSKYKIIRTATEIRLTSQGGAVMVIQ
ncbi:MAG TPA: autotransporter-associated beta strand repeat-containing protein, partial [Kiritimatiellia bacterium]|nr:autotransporter-associated beta strand repeat-containing protein [Kiritimatiellia bacterium]